MNFSYKEGDYIVYDTYGICLIKEIKNMSFTHASPIKPYYILSPLYSKQSTYYVPCDSEKLVSKMRLPLTKSEIEELLKGSYETEFGWIDNRQTRGEKIREILNGGISPELIALIRCLFERRLELKEKGKSLSATDENNLSIAEKMINDEFSFSLGIEKESVADFIRQSVAQLS